MVDYIGNTALDFKDKEMRKAVSFTLELIRDFILQHMVTKLSVTRNIGASAGEDHVSDLQLFLKEDTIVNIIFKTGLIRKVNTLLFNRYIGSDCFILCVDIYKNLLKWYPFKILQDKLYQALVEEDDETVMIKNIRRVFQEIVREVFEDERKISEFIVSKFFSHDPD